MNASATFPFLDPGSASNLNANTSHSQFLANGESESAGMDQSAHSGNTSVDPHPNTLTEWQITLLHQLNFWISGVLTILVVILGLIGNVMTIVILSQRVMRSSTNHYLSVLAAWDSIVLICSLLLISLSVMPNMEAYMEMVQPYVVSYIYPVALIAQTATIWLTVSFTVERYIAVCHPLKAASMCTISRAKIVILGVSLGSALYNIPRWFDYYPEACPSAMNKNKVCVSRTKFSQNSTYLQVYFSWLYVPIMCIIPLLVLAIMNMFLILAVRKSQRQRMDMNVRQSRENNVTIMLVAVVIVFIICQVPALVYNFAFAIDNIYVENNFGYLVLSSVRNFLVTLNSAVNFLLYCALGQKFRRIFLHTFCRRCVNDAYISTCMSGVHHPNLKAAPMKKCHYVSGRCSNVPDCTAHVHNSSSSSSTSHAHTHLHQNNLHLARSTQESSLGNSSGYQSAPCASKRPYSSRESASSLSAASKDKRNKRQQPKGVPLEDERSYDVALEHLLPEQSTTAFTSSSTTYKPSNQSSVANAAL